jgi:hypothetical protein
MVHIVTAVFLTSSLFGRRLLKCQTFERDGGTLSVVFESVKGIA